MPERHHIPSAARGVVPPVAGAARTKERRAPRAQGHHSRRAQQIGSVGENPARYGSGAAVDARRDAVVLIGVGNEYRCDDAAGLSVARSLKRLGLTDVAIEEVSGDVSRLMDLWEGSSAAIVIDAVCSGAKRGTIFRIEAGKEPVPLNLFRSSTHSFGIAETVDMSRRLGTLPERLILYGIEGGEFHQGADMSPEVRQAVREIIDLLRRDLIRLLIPGRM